jgi:hypothetical protein
LAVAWLIRQAPAPLESLPPVPRVGQAAVGVAALAIPAVLTCFVWLVDTASAYDRLGRSIRVSGLALVIALFAYCLAVRAFAWQEGWQVRPVRSETRSSVIGADTNVQED